MAADIPRKVVLSAGMPRAGSGWYYNLTSELWMAAGGQDARIIRKRYHLERVLTAVNCNISNLSAKRLLAVLIPCFLGNSFVIKAHFAPTDFARWTFRRRWIVPTFIFRDPRDAALSAYDYGRRNQIMGRDNAFSRFDTVEKAIAFISDYMQVWQAWVDVPDILLTRYEDLLADYDSQAVRLIVYLGLDPGDRRLEPVVEKHRPGQKTAGHAGLHLNKGRAGRFRTTFSSSQQELCAERFAPWLEHMGYAP